MEWSVCVLLHTYYYIYLIRRRTQCKQLGMPAPIPCLLVKSVQIVMAAEHQQALHSLVGSQTAEVKVRGGQRAAAVITQPFQSWRLDLGQRHKKGWLHVAEGDGPTKQ